MADRSFPNIEDILAYPCISHIPCLCLVSNITILYCSRPSVFNALDEIYDFGDPWKDTARAVYLRPAFDSIDRYLDLYAFGTYSDRELDKAETKSDTAHISVNIATSLHNGARSSGP
jgi:hypothetical protein